MRMTKFLKASLVAATLLSGMAAQASILNFDLTGDYTAHWQYDTDTVPYNPVFGRSFTLTDVTGTFPGASDNTVTIDFASAGDGGGLTIADHSNISIILANAAGSQLYAVDTEFDPAFTLGTFNLTGFDAPASYTLTIADADAAVPEPASAALLLGGLGLMFAAKKRRFGK